MLPFTAGVQYLLIRVFCYIHKNTWYIYIYMSIESLALSLSRSRSLSLSPSLPLSLSMCMHTHIVHVCMYVGMYVCMHVCMYACMCARVHVCMCACVYVYVYMYMYMYMYNMNMCLYACLYMYDGECRTSQAPQLSALQVADGLCRRWPCRSQLEKSHIASLNEVSLNFVYCRANTEIGLHSGFGIGII